MIQFEKTSYNGFYLPEYRLALDASHKDADHVFITHAHADHMPRNRKSSVFCSRPTLKFMQQRGFTGNAQVMEFFKPVEPGDFRVTLYPAGHILGSAMIYLESDQGSLLYTGDCKTPPSPASEGFATPENVDIFITEATFALPIYRWKPIDVLAEEIRDFAATSLQEGFTPVFLAYNLGKAQELMHILAFLDHPVQIHEAGYKMCPVYEEEGIDLGNYEIYDPGTCEGKILIAPSPALNKGLASGIGKLRIAYCSGWAALESWSPRLPVDKRIPLSDHLDFFELIKLCKQLNPGKVYITHSPNPEVVQYYLQESGIDSEGL
jgi:putative mRNA 3-end processing factor